MTSKRTIPERNTDAQEELNSYIEKKVAALHQNSLEILSIVQKFRNKLDGKSYHTLVDLECASALLDSSTTEKMNPSAKEFYKNLFGVQFQRPPIATEKNRNRQIVDEKIEVKTTKFARYLSTLVDKSNQVLLQWDASNERETTQRLEELSDTEFQEFLRQPVRVREKIETHIRLVQQLLPNYNEWALFVWSLNKTPQRLIERTYPLLFDSSEVRKALGLRQISVSGKSNNEVQFTAFPSGSPGNALCDLYLHIWESFDTGDAADVKHFFKDIPNYREEFIQHSVEMLAKENYCFPSEFERIYTQVDDPDVGLRRALFLKDPRSDKTDEKGRDSRFSEQVKQLAPACLLLHDLTFKLRSSKPVVVSL